MFGIYNYWLFILSGLLLNITPGQATLYIIGRTNSQGRRAGILSVLGISTGCLVHTLAAAFGMSAVLAASSHAFMVKSSIGENMMPNRVCALATGQPRRAANPDQGNALDSRHKTAPGCVPTHRRA